jgi:signal transduction histidine kinase
VEEALLEVVATVKPLAAKKRLELAVNITPALPLLNADQLRFTQIMYNLFSNAIKFTPEGGSITVTTAVKPPPPTEGSKSQPAGRLQITVSDTGIGIKPEDQERIFAEFEQGDSSYGRTGSGTGLGLALTRKLIELHGGRIWVESEGVEGKGSAFTFVLPFKRIGATPCVPAKEPASAQPALLAVAKDGQD